MRILWMSVAIGLAASPLRADDSGWIGPGSDFNSAANWSAGAVPTGVALFDAAAPQSLSLSAASTSLDGLTFNVGASSYTVGIPGGGFTGSVLQLNGAGITNFSASTQTIANAGGMLIFHNAASAGNAVIANSGGSTQFYESSTAEHSRITAGVGTNQFISSVAFHNQSTAANATIQVDAGPSGITFASAGFYDKSNAGSALIETTRGGVISFNNNASAGNATLTNTNLGNTVIMDSATLDHATISNSQFGTTSLAGNASAGSATMTMNFRGSLFFDGHSDAGTATIITNSGGQTVFLGFSTGGQASFTTNLGGTVDFSPLSIPSISVGSIAGAGNYLLGSTALTTGTDDANSLVSGTISGNGGSLTKVGAGALTLTGVNTYSGGTILNGGALVVGGFAFSELTPSAYARMSPAARSGVIVAIGSPLGTGDFTMNGGVLKTVGGRYGIIPVLGNYVQNAGTLELKLGGGPNSGLSDALIVGGTARLGGKLQLDLTGGTFTPGSGTTLLLVQAHSIDGNFDVLSGPAGLGLTFDPATGGLELTQKPFAPFAVTANQGAMARYLDAFSVTPTGDFFNLVGKLNTLGAEQVPAALNELSPQRFEMYSDIAFRSAAFTTQELNAHLARLRSGTSGLDMAGMNSHAAGPEALLADAAVGRSTERWDFPVGVLPRVPVLAGAQGAPGSYGGGSSFSVTRNLGAFVSGDAVFARQDGTPDLQKSNFTTTETTGGLDYRLGDHAAAGILFGYTHTGANLDDEGSQAGVSSYAPGLYATYFLDRFYVNGLVSYARNSYNADRAINFADLSRTAHSATRGNQVLLNMDAGMGCKAGAWNLGPAVGLQYVKLKVDGFTESGADSADLNIADQKSDSLRSRLGGQADRPFKTGSVIWTPQGRAAWQHEYLDASREITAGFDQAGLGAFTVQTTAPQRDSALLGAGLSAQLTHAVTLSLNYDVQVGQSRFFAQSIQGGGSIRF